MFDFADLLELPQKELGDGIALLLHPPPKLDDDIALLSIASAPTTDDPSSLYV